VRRIGADEEADGVVDGWPVFSLFLFLSFPFFLVPFSLSLGSSQLHLYLPPHMLLPPTLSHLTKHNTLSMPSHSLALS
jgi:hypothetical protein